MVDSIGGGEITRPVRVRRPGELRNVSRTATRALDVLEFFGIARRPLRAIEIVHALDLHPSSANQLLKTMVESAHLTFDASTKTYLPSPRLVHFSFWVTGIYGGDERLRRLVRHVQSAAGEVVTLTTPNDLFMQVIDLAGADPVPADNESVERGLRVSMFGSATGAAYLSTRSGAELRRLAIRARISERELGGLNDRMRSIRQAGVADGASLDGKIWSIAAPLPVTQLNVPFVLGIAGPAERVRTNLPALSELLRTSIAHIADR